MTADNRSKFIVDLVGNVQERARRFGDSIRRFGAEGSRSMRLFSAATKGANRIIDGFDNKIMGFATGGGLAMAVKNVGKQQQALAELGSQFNLTADQVNTLNAAIWQTADKRKLPYDDLTIAVGQFLEQTNSLDGALTQLDNIGLGMKGIGLEATTAGNKLGVMWNKGYENAEEMRQLLDSIASTSLGGTGNLASQFENLVGLTQNTSWQNKDSLTQLMAMQRISNQSFSDPSQAASAQQGFFDAVKDKDKQKILKRNGVNVYSDEKTKTFKDPAELLLEIGKAAKQKEHNLKDVFSGDTLKMATLFTGKDKQQELRDLSNPENTQTGIIDEKAAKTVQTFNGAMTSLMNAGEKFAQLNLAKPVQDLADAINALSPEELDKYAETIKNVALGIGAVVGARYAIRGAKGLSNMFGGGGAGGPGGGGPGGGPLGAQSVFVTNWPVGGLGGGNNKGGGGVVAGGGGNMAMKAGLAGIITAEVTPYVDDALVWAFGESDRFKKIREAPTWGEFYDAIVGNESQPGNNSISESVAPSLDLSQVIPPPDGSITIELKTPEGIQARTTSIQSENVNLRMNTGYTYSGGD